MAAPLTVLSNGQKIPTLGLGTASNILADTIKYAISAGYRHFDTAWVYGSEKEVGKGIKAAIAENLVKREDIFVTTKLWNTFHEREQVVPACKESLAALGLDYVDLYLIHWPVSQRKTDKCETINISNIFLEGVAQRYEHDLADTWKGMEECVKLGLTKSIGLSNFNENEINHVLRSAEIKPVMNQIKVNPIQNQKELITFCKEKEIHVTAYSPLNAPGLKRMSKNNSELLLDDPRILNIGKKYGKSGSQVILRYLIDIGTIPIPMSSNFDRIKQNINIFDFKLSPEDIEVVDSLNLLKTGIDTSAFK